MTPTSAIAMLDRQIAAHGQEVSFRKADGSATLVARGFIRGYKPDQLVGLIQEGDRQVVLSPSDLGAFGAPANQDLVSINDEVGTVQSVSQTHINDTLVRLDVRVRVG